MKLNSKAILFNAPAKSGKDVAITYLQQNNIRLTIRECKDKLHLLTREFFCVSEERYWEIYDNRELKEVPLDDFKITLSGMDFMDIQTIMKKSMDGYCNFYGTWEIKLSIREAMIYVSEVICKPRFGKDYFGKARAASIREREIITDGSCGFVEELPPLIDKLGQENILLLRIHRNGCTFEGDSRDWIPDGVITNTIDVWNNGSELEYLERVHSIVDKFISNEPFERIKNAYTI